MNVLRWTDSSCIFKCGARYDENEHPSSVHRYRVPVAAESAKGKEIKRITTHEWCLRSRCAHTNSITDFSLKNSQTLYPNLHGCFQKFSKAKTQKIHYFKHVPFFINLLSFAGLCVTRDFGDDVKCDWISGICETFRVIEDFFDQNLIFVGQVAGSDFFQVQAYRYLGRIYNSGTNIMFYPENPCLTQKCLQIPNVQSNLT